MLKMKHTPILTCLDYYEHFDTEDALSDPRELAVFAASHLDFNPINHHCIQLLKAALDPSTQFKITSAKDFWQGADLQGGLPAGMENMISEAILYYRKKAKETHQWEKRCIMTLAATILANRTSFEVPHKENVSLCPKAVALSGSRIDIVPGEEYYFRYLSSAELKAKEKMNLRTVTIHVKPGYSGLAIVRMGAEKPLSLKAGEILYLVVSGEAVVHVLPNQIRYPYGLLQRDCQKNSITFNGKPTGIPFQASSFACFGEGQYMYILNQQLSYIGVDSNLVPYTLSSPNFKCVEVAIRDKNYYVLSRQGIVKDRHAITPPNMQSCFASLSCAIGG